MVLAIPDSYIWWLGLTIDDELSSFDDAYNEALRQGTLMTSEGKWCDYWGDFLGVPRASGETDRDYTYRIFIRIRGEKVAQGGAAETLKTHFGYTNSRFIIRPSYARAFIYNDFLNSKYMTYNDFGIRSRRYLSYNTGVSSAAIEFYPGQGDPAPPLAQDVLDYADRILGGGVVATYTAFTGSPAGHAPYVTSWWPLNEPFGERYDVNLKHNFEEFQSGALSGTGLQDDALALPGGGTGAGLVRQPIWHGFDPYGPNPVFSFGLGIKLTTAYPNEPGLFGIYPDTGAGTASDVFSLTISNTGIPTLRVGADTIAGTTALSLGTWYYLVCIVNNGFLKIRTYTTGPSALDNSQTYSGTITAPVGAGDPLRLGTAIPDVSITSPGVEGLVDNVVLYDNISITDLMADQLANGNGNPL